MAGTNGRKKADDPVELPGYPIDGEFYTVEDLTGKEQRQFRDALRELSGNPTATLGMFTHEEFGGTLLDDFDLICAMTYVIRKRSNDSYTLDEALDLKPKDVLEEGQRILKEQRRRPRKPAGASSES